MNKTPYAEDFLLHQLEIIKSNIKKPIYKELLENIFNEKELFNKFKEAKDKRLRNYKGGILEKVASTGSLALCMYDNYPTIEIDLILTAILLSGFRDSLGRPFFYRYIEKYDDIKELLYKKSRKKPKIEHFIFDEIMKIDERIISKLSKGGL